MATQNVRNTAILTALHTHYWTNGTGAIGIKKNDYALITFAPVIAGLLLCLVIGIAIGFVLLMREKRKRIQEATSLSNLPWLENLEVFAVTDREGAAGMFLPPPSGGTRPSPPPAYESVVKVSEKDKEANEEQQKAASHQLSPMRRPATAQPPAVATPPDDLPTYDAAVKMDGNM